MLEKPSLPDQNLLDHLHNAYGISAGKLQFLPLGADANTAVYRVESREAQSYFLKLRRWGFEEISVLLPRFLYDQGLRQIIPPLPSHDGRLWSKLHGYTSILYPFIEGKDGYEQALTGAQWVEFGAALKSIHSTALPSDLQPMVPYDIYDPSGREEAGQFLEQVEKTSYQDPVAVRMAAFMRAHRRVIRRVVERAGELAQVLASQAQERVLCHADIHAGNLHLTPHGEMYIVDWDNPRLAPKEHDLMFTGGGVSWSGHGARGEALFYQGYGPVEINRTALAYYRYERIVQDFAAYSQQILLVQGGEEDREQGLGYFASNFQPGNVIEVADRTYEQLVTAG